MQSVVASALATSNPWCSLRCTATQQPIVDAIAVPSERAWETGAVAAAEVYFYGYHKLYCY